MPRFLKILFLLVFEWTACSGCSYIIFDADEFILRTPNMELVPQDEVIRCIFNINYNGYEEVVAFAETFEAVSCLDCCDLNYVKLNTTDNIITLCPQNMTYVSMIAHDLKVEIVVTNHNRRKEEGRAGQPKVEDFSRNETVTITTNEASRKRKHGFLDNRNKFVEDVFTRKDDYVIVRLYNTKLKDYFQCYDKEKFIHESGVCNLKFDCQDHSDEINCGGACVNNQAPCDAKGLDCFSPKGQRCDGIVDCPHAEDELNCTSTCPQLHCRNMNVCYNFSQLCDGTPDCSDRSDENNCPRHKCDVSFDVSLHFMCRNHKCINRQYVNDGNDDCGDGSDEQRARPRLNYISVTFILAFLMCIIFVYLVCKRIFAGRRRNNNFALPMDFPQRRSPDYDDYPNPDLQRGGVIFDAYLESQRDRDHRTANFVASKQKIAINRDDEYNDFEENGSICFCDDENCFGNVLNRSVIYSADVSNDGSPQGVRRLQSKCDDSICATNFILKNLNSEHVHFEEI